MEKETKYRGLRRGFGLLRPLARKLVGPLAVLGLLTLSRSLRERSCLLYLLGGGRVGNQLVNKALGIDGAHVAGLAWHGQQGAQGRKANRVSSAAPHKKTVAFAPQQIAEVLSVIGHVVAGTPAGGGTAKGVASRHIGVFVDHLITPALLGDDG